MKIDDKILELLNLKEVNDFIRLFQHLCGQELSQINLQDRILLQNICEKPNLDLDYEQLNTILLILNQPTVSEEFFKFFFEGEKIENLEQLKRGVSKFRAYAMLCYGNFRFAYKDLSRMESNKFKQIAQGFSPERENETKICMEKRPDRLIEIESIPKEETYFLGYLSGAQVNRDFMTFAAVYSLRKSLSAEKTFETLKEIFPSERDPQKMFSDIDKTKKDIAELDEVESLDLDQTSEKLVNIRKRLEATRKIGQKNTDTYLTLDYMDVYVATSMREKWEYLDCWNFTNKVFQNEGLKELKIRYFDPTQSYVFGRIDKGLIEGLMLKRAECTLYLVQETDTLGKDSELAATLAQGKPVIAFVPNIEGKEQMYKEKYKSYGLRFLAKRLMLLEAEETLEQLSLQEKLASKFGHNYENTLNDSREKVREYFDLRLFYSWESKSQEKLRKDNNDFDVLWEMLVEVEKFYLNKRADTLLKAHPLAIQVDINTGIANGVLVVRDENDCAQLLRKILTNDLDFEIVHEAEEKVTILKENMISNSPYRVVTDYERLTNSFWNFYLT
ncbi:MAG: hypothetical protein QMD05_05505 [Candidatus Brocadiaceae bacterium]|nr:hypothetical protein [Candidatus Brocadiaceae bacterium]